MKPSGVAGVLAADPAAGDPAAYPLTALSYAVTAPCTLDTAASKDYATFLRYAGGQGQQPGVNAGQLPLGMVPLPDALKAQTIAAASTIDDPHTCAPPAGPSPPTSDATITAPHQNPTGPSTPAANTSGTTANSGGAVQTTAPSAGTPPGGGLPSPTPGPAQQAVASRQRTPSLLAPAVGGLFLAILICVVVAAVNPPVLRLLRTSAPVRYLLSAAARRRVRKEVTPTER